MGALLVDLGDPSTWPEAARTVVDDLYERARQAPDFHGKETYTADLHHLVGPDLAHSADGELRSALGNVRLLAYHATRLLPSESRSVRNDGIPGHRRGV